MLSKKLKKILIITLLGLSILLGAKSCLSRITQPTKPIVISQVKKSILDENILHKETIVSKFNSTRKIQVIQTNISQEVTISQGFNNDLFKNNKIITFNGIGKYMLDLSKINKENIIIDNSSKQITIFTSKPSIEIELLEEKTQFQNEQGLFRFSDVEVTPEEYESMKYQVKQQMIGKLNSAEYDKIVKQKTKESLEGLLNKLTQNKYKININIVE